MKSLEKINEEIKLLKNRDLTKIETKELEDDKTELIDLTEELNHIVDDMYVELRFRELGKTNRSNFESFKQKELKEFYKLLD